MDTGATHHVCSKNNMFSTYNLVGNRGKIFMGNSSTSKIEGIEKVVLKITTGRFLTLKDQRCTSCAKNSKEPCI